MTRDRFRRLTAAFSVAAGGAAAMALVAGSTAKLWIGSYDLTVRVDCPDGPPRTVTCEAFGYRVDADEAAAHALPPDVPARSPRVEPFRGEPITVTVLTTGRDSFTGDTISRAQMRYLVVVGIWPDGRRVGVRADIPDRDTAREMRVTLPGPPG